MDLLIGAALAFLVLAALRHNRGAQQPTPSVVMTPTIPSGPLNTGVIVPAVAPPTLPDVPLPLYITQEPTDAIPGSPISQGNNSSTPVPAADATPALIRSGAPIPTLGDSGGVMTAPAPPQIIQTASGPVQNIGQITSVPVSNTTGQPLASYSGAPVNFPTWQEINGNFIYFYALDDTHGTNPVRVGQLLPGYTLDPNTGLPDAAHVIYPPSTGPAVPGLPPGGIGIQRITVI